MPTAPEDGANELARLRQQVTDLQASEARFRGLVETSFDWIWESDADNLYTYVSPRARTILGYEPEELVGRSPFELMPPEEAERVHTMLAPMIAARERIVAVENLNRHKDGRLVLLESNGNPIFDANGRFCGYRGIDRDITERKRLEEERRREDERRRAFFETVSEWLWTIDHDGRHVFTNPAVHSILGYESAEVLGKTAFDFIHDDDRPAVLELLEDEKVKRTGWSGLVVRWKHKDGSYRYLESSAVPVLDDQGNLAGYHGADRDITERLRAEEHQRNLEAQIQQAQKLESLGVLAGGIAHDFNNLLTAIICQASLARNEAPVDAPVHESLGEIERAAGRAADLCRQMLAYAGKAQMAIEAVDLSKLVREVLHLLQVSVSKKVVLDSRLTDGLPAIEADPAQIHQVVMNLVINASEAIGDAGGTIDLSTGLVRCSGDDLRTWLPNTPSPRSAGDYVFVDVRDSGCGMDDETIAKIFDPFFTTKFTGRGLGLAAVLGIVGKHSGALRVESTAGRGTTFRVCFPVARTANAPDTEPAVPVAETRTILLVDDEESIRRVASRILKRNGYRVVTARDGIEAVELFRAQAAEIDAVVLDLAMPRMGGAEAFRKMQEIRPDVRVLMASGYADQETNQQFAGKGIAGFIGKPYQLETLTRKVRAIMPDGRHQADPGRSTVAT